MRNESSVRDLVGNIGRLGRSELELAAAEFREGTSHLKQSSKGLVAGVSLLLLSVFPLVAFLVVGLGRLLHDRYWLSSLIVGLVFVGVGGALAFISLRRLEFERLSFPQTRKNLKKDGEAIAHSIHLVDNEERRQQV